MNAIDGNKQIDELKQDLRRAARDILDDQIDEEKINILAAPGDSPLCVQASAANNSSRRVGPGYPVARAPIGQLRYNDRPFGLCLVARANEEQTLLRFMGVYEEVAKPGPVPKFRMTV
ncbi:amidase signature enzyme [Penicillium desertorum]|uniref:Amidase signature enzyme n=1 Tax=Penicillium desertorum TaxID=1303715 RepID=A0A9W9WK63_9EURO|nr:amidase signature enzyme [Penicillium desertorum]